MQRCYIDLDGGQVYLKKDPVSNYEVAQLYIVFLSNNVFAKSLQFDIIRENKGGDNNEGKYAYHES